MKKLRRDGCYLSNFIKSQKHSKFKSYVLLACLGLITVFILFNLAMAKYIITEEKEISFALNDINLKESEIIIEPDYWTNDSVKLTVEADKSGEIYYKINEDGEWKKYEGELNIDENCDIYFKLVYEDGDGPETIKKITNIVKPKEEVARVTTDRYSVIFDSVQQAIDAAGEEEAVVTLLKDNIEECVTVAENQNIVLDVNGKTLAGVNESTITNNGTLTISGESGTITCSGADTIKNAGTLVKDTETKIENTSEASYYVINNTGETTISAGTIYSDWRGIGNYDDGKVTITGGTLTTVSTTIHNFGIAKSESSPAIKITGNPTLTSTSSNVISNSTTATGLIYINGGTINQPTPNASTPTVINSGDGKIIIEEGIIKCSGKNSVVYNGYNNGNGTGTVEIRGGTIESDTARGITNNEKGNVIISGGTITSVNHGIRNGDTGTVTVTGGNISSTGGYGIYNTGTIIVGDDDDSVSTEEPSITGKTGGVYAESGTFNFYDGVIKGESGEGSAIKGEVAETPEGYAVVKTADGTVETAILESTKPTIVVSPASATACKEKSVKITIKNVGGESELSSSNSYQYYLSSSSTDLKDGTWKDYTSGTAFTIGTGITGTRYLFVKRVSDNAEQVSTGNGTATTISGVTYQRFGSYVFDNTKPTAWINTESMYVTDGLVTRLDGVNNNGGSRSSSVATWKDISSNGKNGTITSGTWGANYLDFNGTSTWVSLGVMNNDYQTIEVTFSPDVVPTSQKCIIGNWETGGGGIQIDANGYIKGNYYIGGAYKTVTSRVKVVANQKYHVAVTYNGTEVILYVNGVEQGRTSVSGTIGVPTSSTVMVLGAQPSGSNAVGEYFDGKIYNAAVYNKALTAEQVKKNADAGKALAGGPTNASSITYTIRFNEKVTGFTTEDITVTNGTKGTFTQVTEGSVYRVAVTTAANQNNTQTIAISADGCTDIAGNGIAATSKEVVIDRVAPTVTLSPNGGTYNITPENTTVPVSTTLTASDTGSGIAGLSYAWGTSKSTEPSSWTGFTSGTAVTKALSGGNNYLWTNVIDNAGNRATSIKTSEAFTVNYQVAFDANYGTGAPSAQYKVHGTNLTLSSTKPTRTGYTFKEWNTKADGTGTKYLSGASYTANSAVTLYAQWTANTNTKYVVNHYVHDLGATTYTLNSTDNKTGTSDASLTVANLKKTIAGFTYEDGYTTGNTTKPSSGAVTTTTILPDGTRVINLYYRRNRLYIQYNINGGTFSSTDTAYGTSGSLVTYNSDTKFLRGYYGTTVNGVTDTSKHILSTNGLHDYNNPNAINISKTGYSGKSGAQWNTKADGTGTSYSHSTSTYSADNFGGKDLSTGDQTVVLYVNWVANKYKVTLDNQGATTAGTTAYWYKYNTTTTVDGTTIYYYTDEAMSSGPMKGSTITKPTKTGYTFGGYYTGTNGTGTQYINENGLCVNSIYKVAENTTLYAKWTPNNYTITYDYNYMDNELYGNKPLTTDFSNATTTGTTSRADNTAAKFGKEMRWTVTSLGTGTGTGGPHIQPPNRLTVGNTYTWSVYLKASKNMKLNVGQEQNGRKVVDVTTSWQRFTYTFTAGDTTYNSFTFYYSSGTNWAVGDVLYMHSLELKETPSLNITTQTKTYGGTLGTLPTASRTGYTFDGWYTAPVGGTKIATSTAIPAANTTYYARWTANNYTITFNYNGQHNYATPAATLTKSSFTGGSNQGLTVATGTFDGLKSGDTLHITYDMSYTNLTAATGQSASLYSQGTCNPSGDWVTMGSSAKQTLSGSGTTKFDYTVSLTDAKIANNAFRLAIRFDYYASGSVTVSNVKITRVTTETKTLAYGTQLGTLPTPTEAGYTLNGWYTASSGGTKISSTTTVPAKDTTYYAQWVDKTAPVIVSATASTTSDIASYVDFNATDGGSGIKYYNISTSTTAPTTWIPVVSAVEATTETKYENSAAWARVFHHNNHWGNVLFSSANSGAEAKSSNTVDKYSVLGNIANYKNSSNWEFMLQYPDVSATGYNRWTQTSNPVTSNNTISGYAAVGTPTWTGNAWGGLALSSTTSSTLIDGSPGDSTWYYAIGAYSAYKGGIPGPNSTMIGTVNLWSRIDNLTSTTSSNLTRRLGGLKSNTTYYVWVKDESGNTASKAVTVSNVDATAPTATITSTNNVAASQTATLTIKDTVGLDKYYWGTTNPASNNVTYTATSGTSQTITKTVSAGGTYYLAVLDKAGNRTITSKAFYKTTLTPNRSSVSPASVITMAGNSFTIPTPTAVTGYTFNGWYKESALTNSAGTSYTPTSSTTLYGKWTAHTYTVKYNGNGNTGGSTANSSHTYDVAKNLTANGFTRTGHTFAGWSTSSATKMFIFDTAEHNQTTHSYWGNGFIADYAVPGICTAGNEYQLELDIKGSGSLYSYIYHASPDCNAIATVTASEGETYASDSTNGYGGYGMVELTSDYKHYTLRFTVGNDNVSNGWQIVYDGAYAYIMFGTSGTATIKNVQLRNVIGNEKVYANSQSVTNLSTTNGATVNLYATWKANTYTISLDANYGSGGQIGSLIATYGEAMPIPGPLLYSGYTFAGFSLSNFSNNRIYMCRLL